MTIGADALPAWRTLPAPRAALRAVVIVPARDEAAHIERALEALAGQVDARGAPIDADRFEILVFANNCDDDTADRARRFAAARPRLALHVVEARLEAARSNIGFVRRQLMDAAWQRLHGRGSAAAPAVIASTDADTRVAPDWLAGTLEAIDAGADAVGGRIVTDACVVPTAAALRRSRLDSAHGLLRARLESLLDADPHDPWPRHHQHFGASLAVRAAAYAAIGGVPRVQWLEDEALVRALRRADRAVRHSPDVRVTTSSRLDGRAEVGLSFQLRQWADEARGDGVPREPHVADAGRFEALLRARSRLRAAWRGSAPRAEATSFCDDALRFASGTTARRLDEGGAFGAVWDDLLSAHDEAMHARGEAVPVREAVPGLRARVRRYARSKASSR